MTIHQAQHPKAGEVVKLKPGVKVSTFRGREELPEIRVEDWWDRVAGQSWMFSNGNPAALSFAVRSVTADLPTDDEVLYGHDPSNGLGHLVHVSELADGGDS